MREYETREAADEAASEGFFGCGTHVMIGGVEHILAALAGGCPSWERVVRTGKSPVPPLRKFASVHDARKAVRCGGLQIDDSIEIASDVATVAAIDRVGEEFVLVWSNGRQTAHAFYADGEGRCDPAPDPAPHPRARTLPDDSASRKEIPIAEGCLFYFPAALAQVARISKIGNDKHNPGEPMHHARGKSMDHEDCIVRHTLDARESDGAERIEHLAARAWRALAALQEECERQGSPLAPNAKEPDHDD